jgi:hypothetical protein
VLARLEALEDVDRALVDHSGDLLRLSLHDECPATAAIALLTELGYGAESASDADGVIADRIVPSFAESRKLSPVATARVRGAVVDSLHDCFTSSALGSGPSLGAFRLSCERAVEDAVRPIVGREPAGELAALLSTDMGEDHRGR